MTRLDEPAAQRGADVPGRDDGNVHGECVKVWSCLLYTSDAADERSSVDLGGRRIIKKNKEQDVDREEGHVNEVKIEWYRARVVNTCEQEKKWRW